jgi:hypothetical protein
MTEFDREIRSEARGAHGVAWVAGEEGAVPGLPVLMVGQTPDQAVARLREGLRERGPGREAGRSAPGTP